MKRVPLVPTIIVAAAIATMVALGVWQLGRASWKEALLARYAAAATLPPVALPAANPGDDRLLFRRAAGVCQTPLTWRARGGRSRDGRSGWRHILTCRSDVGGRTLAADLGWSTSYATPRGYRGGRITGVVDRDRDHGLLLVADAPAPGLAPSALPSPESVPNNHLAYAGQWFLFAIAAALIYALALRARWRAR